MLRLLSIEHHLQEERAGCLAACAQMALACVGVRQSQQKLNRLFGLKPEGVPSSRIVRLENLGVVVHYVVGDEQSLRAAIDRGVPPIVFLLTGDLPAWKVNLRHAVLVVGYDEHLVYINDPEFPVAPQKVTWGDFMLAWSEFDYRCALIESP